MSVFSTERLHNKVVLVTGASGGIGEATAILFAKAGSNVILTARREEQLKKVEEACVAAHKASGVQAGGKFFSLKLDVSDKVAVKSMKERIPADLQAVDILVNNAGFVLGLDKVGEISPEDMEAMFTTNVFGLINVTQAFINDMKKRGAGHIINIGSVAGREAYPGGGIYCATKAAVASFTVSLMKEVVDTPIRVSEVQPGMVETNFSVVRFRGDSDKASTVYKGLEPLSGEDCAEDIVWVASRPPHVQVAQLFVMPTNQASPTLVYRGQ